MNLMERDNRVRRAVERAAPITHFLYSDNLVPPIHRTLGFELTGLGRQIRESEGHSRDKELPHGTWALRKTGMMPAPAGPGVAAGEVIANPLERFIVERPVERLQQGLEPEGELGTSAN